MFFFCLKDYKQTKIRSAIEALSKSDKQIYLSTVWPDKSFIKAKTAVGVFLFTKGQSSNKSYAIPIKLLIKSWVSGKLYLLLNPLQIKISKFSSYFVD